VIDAIDCIAFYDITLVRPGGAFNPSAEMTRWQMALFLTRSVTALGLDLPSAIDQGFVDIGGLGSTTQQAINQLKQLGITQGTSIATFDPQGSVPRWQMALFLVRLMNLVGVALPDGAPQGFTDIGAFDSAAETAINQLRQMGIALGTGPTTFDPQSVVVRWQMALFLARAVDVGGAFPYTITIDSTASAPTGEPLSVVITVQNPDGSPATLRRVDVFVGSRDPNGGCAVSVEATINGAGASTGTPCAIDGFDPLTNAEGEVALTVLRATVGAETIYAWIGESGEVFGNAVRGDAGQAVIWVEPPTALRLPDDLTAPYGTSVSITAQFEREGVPLAFPGQPVRFLVSRNAALINDVEVLAAADGGATLVVIGPADPTGADDPSITDTVTAFWDRNGNGVVEGADELVDSMTVIWDD
jgi:hypothetical protein